MTVPDAWDECGACGHDRDDHHRTGCHTDLVTYTAGQTFRETCPCNGFEEPAA